MSKSTLRKTLSTNLYIRFRPEITDQKRVYDFTEKKLLKMITESDDKEEKNIFINSLKDYVNGRIAIHWDNGIPIITRNIRG